MIWADIADARMTFLAHQTHIHPYHGHRFSLFLSTENYKKAELFHPVRYTYISTLDSSFKKTLLVEKMDTGKNQSHDFLWLDWPNKATQLYKKREKIITEAGGFFDLDSPEIQSWEKDGELAVPDFLNVFPLQGNKLSYLVHKESGDPIKHSQVIDPLSFIYHLRILDEHSLSKGVDMALAISDDIRIYRITPQGAETLQAGEHRYSSLKYSIQTDDKIDNYYTIWLSNDKQKIPLRMTMDAPLGKLRIELVAVSQSDYSGPDAGALNKVSSAD